jgi:CheY-like chemotaxis protein
MQKAQNLAGSAGGASYSAVEEQEEMARGLSAVGKLIGTGDYQNARSLASDIKGWAKAGSIGGDEDNFAKLNSMLETRDYSKAGGLASTMEKGLISQVKRVGGGAAGSMKKILSVDDRPEILTSVSAALSGHYKVLGAPSGDAALKVMAQHTIDLFILDIDMPGMDGFELTQRIRADVKYKNTPIIYLTGNAARERIKRSMELDIRDFIVKPAYNETLLAKAGKFLN